MRCVLIVAAFAVLACATGCSSSGACSSTTNASPTYSCAMQAVDAGGCPAIQYPQAEPGAYALGCTATFEGCSAFFSPATTSTLSCTCQLAAAADGGSNAPIWACP